MISIKYQWHSLVTVNSNTDFFQKRLSTHGLKDLELPSKNVDENFFTSREDAIKWLEKMKEADELFADGDCLILTEMFFT